MQSKQEGPRSNGLRPSASYNRWRPFKTGGKQWQEWWRWLRADGTSIRGSILVHNQSGGDTIPELTTNPSTHAQVEVYQFHVLLLQISPAIWRSLLVRSDSSIADLHYTLQIIVGWEDLHLHRLVGHGNEYGIAKPGGVWFHDDPTQILLSDLRLRLKFHQQTL